MPFFASAVSRQQLAISIMTNPSKSGRRVIIHVQIEEANRIA